MGLFASSIIAALIAAGAAAGAGGIARGVQSNTNSSGQPHKYTGWANQMWGADNTSASDLARWFRGQAGNNSYLNTLSDAELGSILNQYYYQNGGALGNYTYDFDLRSALQDLGALNGIGSMPTSPNWDALAQQAKNDVALENAQINSLYDKNLASQKQLYQQEMQNNNRMYNDYARQILSNDYQKNAQLMGSLGNSLDRARTSALEAGASAGLRLSNNINTLLSTQNKQAQQSLDTAINLSQNMLNQRQAAAGLRGSHSNTLANDTANRTNLMRGNAERTTNYQNAYIGQQQSLYDNKMNSWENANSQYSSNPFYGSYMANKQKQSYTGGGSQ